MSDGVFKGYPTRLDDLPVMVASDCIEIGSFFPTPFHDIESIFIECGGATILKE
jgi:hypothetical protein